jgi:hypothetical protein
MAALACITFPSRPGGGEVKQIVRGRDGGMEVVPRVHPGPEGRAGVEQEGSAVFRNCIGGAHSHDAPSYEDT